jgi:hypothetical protein
MPAKTHAARGRGGRFIPATVSPNQSSEFTQAFLAFVKLHRENPRLLEAIEDALTGPTPDIPATPVKADAPSAEPRPARVKWKKTARGDARIWTANAAGHLLRVERKKTAAGIVFDAYLDDVYQHRNKSSVTARDRLAMKLARAEATGDDGETRH